MGELTTNAHLSSEMTDLGADGSDGVSSSSWRYLPSTSAKPPSMSTNPRADSSSVSLLLLLHAPQVALHQSLTTVPSSFARLHRFLFTAGRGEFRNSAQVRVSPFLLITMR